VPARAVVAVLQQTRRHHAIEHATIHLLAARYPRVTLGGLSDPWGFTLFGRVSRESVEDAVCEALLRLKAGEEEMAFHPNCGTSLTTRILLATAAAIIGSAGSRRTLFEKVTLTTGLVTLGLLIAGPLGMRLQRLTTSAAVDCLGLADIVPVGEAHRVTFSSSN